MTLRQTLRPYYPFSMYGTLVLAGALTLIGQGLLTRNPYELSSAALVLLLLICGAAGSFLISLRVKAADIRADWKNHLQAGAETGSLAFVCTAWPLGSFFRLHISVEGHLVRGGQKVYRFQRQIRLDQPGRTVMPLVPPVSGELHVTVRFSVRDLLGLSCLSLKEERNRRMTIFPRRIGLPPEDFPSAVDNQEDQSPSKPLEHEKVFTREYIPGDRFRDINWKAAGRVQKLLTRIPPEALGSSRQIDVLVHSLVPDRSRAIGRIWYEDCLTSLVFSFLEEFRAAYPGWICRLTLNRQEFSLSDEESYQRFLREFCSREAECLRPEDLPLPEETGSFFLFTTCFHTRLSSFLTRVDRENARLFLIQPHVRGGESPEAVPDWEFRLFQGDGHFLPRLSSLRGKLPVRLAPPSSLQGLKEFSLKAGVL